jgi:para-aminobenzoate synthetase component 1
MDGRRTVPDPAAVFALVDSPGAVWLDGGSRSWSILAWDPDECVTDPVGWRDRVGPASTSFESGEPPFTSGWIGFLGYGMGHHLEPRIPKEADVPEGLLWLGHYRGAMCWHPVHGWFVHGNAPFRRQAERALAAARPIAIPPVPAEVRRVGDPGRPQYEAGVSQIRQRIAAGDCYQVNLTRAVHLAGVGEAFPAWLRARRMADAKYGAFLRLSSDVAVLSSSPESLLDVSGPTITSTPIKGTRPRSADPVIDRALAFQLLRSEKEVAELEMIVDLVRNDLGRISDVGSVTWSDRTVSAHPNVHHAARTISARLAPGRDAWDALSALFPPGSVTGAPKIRACQRIAELESEPRGVYCGTIGFVSDTGRSSWNVAIRTGVWQGSTARYHVGGGITWDSETGPEWAETVHKGTILARAFAGTPDPDAGVPAVHRASVDESAAANTDLGKDR